MAVLKTYLTQWVSTHRGQPVEEEYISIYAMVEETIYLNIERLDFNLSTAEHYNSVTDILAIWDEFETYYDGQINLLVEDICDDLTMFVITFLFNNPVFDRLNDCRTGNLKHCHVSDSGNGLLFQILN